jgi:hypothetical protein
VGVGVGVDGAGAGGWVCVSVDDWVGGWVGVGNLHSRPLSSKRARC